MSYSRITQCRICGNKDLVEVLDLGNQTLTGLFPESAETHIPSMPLVLVKCHGGKSCCHLLQLAHTYDLAQLYGEHYGYRSGLNTHIKTHLKQKVTHIESSVTLSDKDLVLDIGSNDGTTLSYYTAPLKKRVGIDPTADKFRHFYPENIDTITDFFSKAVYSKYYGEQKAKVVTAFSMFYDLTDPVAFAKDVADILDEQGIWILEQSYMPTMLKRLSYDTVCHEHLEYYGLKQIQWIMEKVGLIIIDVSFNDLNGGSFSITISHPNYSGEKHTNKVQRVIEGEQQFESLLPFQQFAKDVATARDNLLKKLHSIKSQGKKVAAIGASTKGNVILQYCAIDASLVDVVGEVNPDKFGRFTPSTLIPIQPEDLVLNQAPDYLLVLPWHLWRFFEEDRKFADHELIYPILDPR